MPFPRPETRYHSHKPGKEDFDSIGPTNVSKKRKGKKGTKGVNIAHIKNLQDRQENRMN